MIAKAALLLFPLLMAFAASSDLLTMRISNRLIAVLIIGFFAVALATNMPFQDLAIHVTTAVGVLVLTFTFFAMGWVGGGDAKLAAATALWLGFPLTFPYLLVATVFGGVLTMLLLSVRRFPLPDALFRIGWINRLHDKKTGIPYGIALAIAGILYYSDTAIFQQLSA